MGERAGHRARSTRRVLIDLTPLRRSRDLRCLVLGELISVLGTQLTTVAVPYQVYQLTRSSPDVGLVSLTQLVPLIAGSLLGGSVVDAQDRRRRLLMVAQAMMAASSADLAVNTDSARRCGRCSSSRPCGRRCQMSPSTTATGSATTTGQRTWNSGHARNQLAYE